MDSVVLKLDIISVAEDVAIPFHNGARSFKGLGASTTFFKRPRDLSRKTAAQTDQTFAVLLEEFFVDSRLVVKAFDKGDRRKLQKIFIPLLVHCEERQVMHQLFAFLKPRPRRDVRLVTDNRLDSRGERLLVEFERRVHVAVVCYRERWHFQLFCALDERFQLAETVKKGIVRVRMQVDEWNRARLRRTPRGLLRRVRSAA